MISEIQNNKFENRLHSIFLVLGMTALMSLVGWLLFGRWGLFGALSITMIGIVFGPRMSAKLVLRMYKAQPINHFNSPALHRLFRELCKRAELPAKPGLYYIPSRMPNAFATGVGKNSAVAITDGLIRMLTPRELAGVLAHEIAHLRHHDTRVMGLADTIGRMTSFFSRLGLLMFFFCGANILMGGSGIQLVLVGILMFFAPTLIAIMQLALSRSREFNADMGAVELTGDPHGLASALKKLDPESSRNVIGKIFMPDQMKQPAMLRTHPPTEDRVRELMSVAQDDVEKRNSVLEKTKFNQKEHINRHGEPIIYIGFPKVRERERYRFGSGTYR